MGQRGPMDGEEGVVANLIVLHHGERPLHGLDPVLGDLCPVALLDLCDAQVGPAERWRGQSAPVASGWPGPS